MKTGRPRQYASNADRQRAYRQRHNSKSVTKLAQAVQSCRAAIDAHGPYQPDSAWINRSAELFGAFLKARRALLGVDPRHPVAVPGAMR